ncbi:MAG: FAD-binding oxidoreductase [Chroococcidiopsidaceae cyanobacterium CP_BM_ER_R8_30]|nr:FAD-binding oxidoreductase [Chroococcidiopsidaceae cyanobacterium CP_BM_ER_R8_30]
MNEIIPQFESIVGSTGIYAWEDIDVPQQKQALQAIAPGTHPQCIVYPNTQAELAEVIACAYHHKACILPRGNGSKLSWGGLGEDILVVVSTKRLNQLIQHAVGDLTVTVEAGTKFAALQDTLAQERQFLALDPTAPESATLGGIVATSDTGSWRQRYGGVRDQLLGISFVRADGKIAKAGGRVVKNVAGYDLMKLLTGSYGTLGVITQVTFRVYPLPETSATVVLTGTKEAITQATTTLRTSALTPTAADLISNQLVERLSIGQGLGLVTRFQSIKKSVVEQSTQILAIGEHLSLQGTFYSDGNEANLWQKLRSQIGTATTESEITCKIGVIPSQAVAIVAQMEVGLIHAGSGLGWLWWENAQMRDVLEMRSLCQSHGGFLTVLEAPITLKQQMDTWGYTGNALNVMRHVKQQFDHKNILSPGRFVDGI